MLSTVPRLAAAETAPAPFDDQIAGRLQHGRIVVLGEQVDDAIANRICAQLLLLSQEDPKRDIVLFVNSPGGSVHAGMAIYDTMRFIPNDVATLAMGFAASMGQFLLCAGTPGKRYALPNARIMMHQPSGGLGGTAADIAVQAENLAYTKLTMQKLIAEHCGQSLETIAADQRRDRWFTAEQAKEYGFVDRVVRSVAELGGDAASGFGFEPAAATGGTGATAGTVATGKGAPA
ncbi:ClpP family protease [Streptomyces sp. NPDC058155]|uniref:ClpP family protease n=1 Tax=Streptomyces sp. NPDC058155 TaxID=3346359 RepID=UPI0036E0C07A